MATLAPQCSFPSHHRPSYQNSIAARASVCPSVKGEYQLGSALTKEEQEGTWLFPR